MEYPKRVSGVKAKVNDSRGIDELFMKEKSIYVFDRGYTIIDGMIDLSSKK